MGYFTTGQKKKLGEMIRRYKERNFPGKGGGGLLAQQLGISPQLLSHWMSGTREPPLEQLSVLSEMLGMSLRKMCSMPKIKRNSTKQKAYDTIIELTNFRKGLPKNRKVQTKERVMLLKLNSLIYNTLQDIL